MNMKRWLIPLVLISLCTFLFGWERLAQAGSVERTILRSENGTIYYVIRFNTLGTELNYITTLYLTDTTTSNESYQKAQSGTCGITGNHARAASGVTVSSKIFDITKGKHSGVISMPFSPAIMNFDPTGDGTIDVNNDGTPDFSCGTATHTLSTGGGSVPAGFVVTYANPFNGTNPVEPDFLTAYTFNGGSDPTVDSGDLSGSCPTFPGDGIPLAGGQGVILCWTPTDCSTELNFVAGAGSMEVRSGKFNGRTHVDTDNIVGCRCIVDCDVVTGNVLVTFSSIPCPQDLQVQAVVSSSNPQGCFQAGVNVVGATSGTDTEPLDSNTCTASFTITKPANCDWCITFNVLNDQVIGCAPECCFSGQVPRGCTITCTEGGKVSVNCTDCGSPPSTVSCEGLKVKATSSDPTCVSVVGATSDTDTEPVDSGTCTAHFDITRHKSSCGACITYALLDASTDQPISTCNEVPATSKCCAPGISCTQAGVASLVIPQDCQTECQAECSDLEVVATSNSPSCATVDGGSSSVKGLDNCGPVTFNVQCEEQSCSTTVSYVLRRKSTAETDPGLVKDSTSCDVTCGAFQGCTPGYWKNLLQHGDEWEKAGFAPNNDKLCDAKVGFVIPDCIPQAPITGPHCNHTMRRALSYIGGAGKAGAARILLRAAVAALLNASHPDVNYPLSKEEVVSLVNKALASCSRTTMLTLATQLDTLNNAGCPLN